MDGHEFEREVREIARALWPSEPGAGAAEIIDGRERDCIFRQEFVTHYIECTTSRKLDKVKKDAKKLVEYRKKQNKTVKLWVVTLHEPTPHQKTHCRKKDVEILSIDQFRKYIIDARKYLELRMDYPFGSAADPKNNSTDISTVKYQPVGIRRKNGGGKLSVREVADIVQDGNHVLLLGDYGMGKSINIREIFLELRKRYFKKDKVTPIPVVINLREHWGQDNPSEALQRHARNIGFENYNELVRAFNAGRLVVCLDGFDEVGSQAWSRLPESRLRNMRRQSVQLVTRFVERSRGKCGLLIAGRGHFFDSLDELESAFGLRGDYITLELDEFTDEEAKDYLLSQGYDFELPEWFPRRPLLLASLAAKGMLDAVLETAEGVDPAVAWNKLIDLICEREAKIHTVLDSNNIRAILENLASVARTGSNGLGPITEDHIAEAFRAQTGAYPDQVARPLLQRLPGLSVRDPQEGSRNFLDDQMLDVLRAGDVLRFFRNPWGEPKAEDWVHGIDLLGASVVVEKINESRNISSEAKVAAREANSRWNSPTLALDMAIVGQVGSEEQKIDLEGLNIIGGCCETLDIADLPVLSNVELSSCLIREMIIPDEEIDNFCIRNSVIKQVIGVVNEKSLPSWIDNCDIVEFDTTLPNAEIMRSNRFSLPVRVLMTILKKIYRQRGSGRKENALYRGLDTNSQSFVDPIIEILQRSGFAYSRRHRGSNIWYPAAGKKARVNDILEAGGRSNDEVVKLVKKL